MTDVELTPLGSTAPAEEHEFLALSMRHIVFAVPFEDQP